MKTRTLTTVILTLALALGVGTPAFTQQTTIGGTAGVTITPRLEFGWVQVRQITFPGSDPLGGTPLAGTTGFTFAFDPLVPVNNPTNGALLYYTGTYWYSIFMIPSTSGRPYVVQETGTVTAGTFPSTSVLMVPDYQAQDRFAADDAGTAQGLLVAGETVGPPTSIVGTNQPIYTSTTGRTRILRCYLAIGGPKAGDTYPSNQSGGYDGAAPIGSPQFYEDWTPITPATPGTGGTASVGITITLSLIPTP